jgi:hypothetical protein
MKQNKYFSIGRFTRLLQNDWLINQKTYLFAIVGLSLAVYSLIYFSMITTRSVTINQYTGFIIFYMMGVGIVVGTSFPAINNQIKMSNYLLVPGSTFEKFMVQFVIRIVLFIPIALLIFWICAHLAKASLIPFSKIGYDSAVQIADFHYRDLIERMHPIDRVPAITSIFSALCTLFAGSVYFKRFALVKTLVSLGIIYFAIIFSFILFSNIFFPYETSNLRTIDFHTYKISRDLTNTQLFAYLIGCLSWIFFLPLAYFKLKEKEL